IDTEFLWDINHPTIFKNSKLIGDNIAETTLKNVQFLHCINTFSSYNFAKLTRVIFPNSVLDQAEFQETNWKKLWLKSNRMELTDFSNTNLNGLDLTSNQFNNLIFSKELIQGATIEPMQALAICEGMGVRVSE